MLLQRNVYKVKKLLAYRFIVFLTKTLLAKYYSLRNTRYSHATQELKRNALKKWLTTVHVNVTPKKPEKKKTAGCASCRKLLILLVEQRGPNPWPPHANG